MPWWSWIVLGAVLLISEIVASAEFYLVFFGASAIVLGLLGATGVSLSVPWQWILFAALSIVTLVLFRARLRRTIRTRESEVDTLVGQIVLAQDGIASGGSGHAAFRGSVWAVKNAGSEAIDAGDRCIVENVDGLVLTIRRAP